MTFGEILARLMEQHNLSREQLAEKLGVSYWSISKYLINKRFPDPENIAKIADIFNVTIDYLYGRQLSSKNEDCLPENLPKEAQKSLDDYRDYIIYKYGKRNI